MPTPADTIQPFVERLLRDPGVLMTDEAFVRSFNLLGLPLRRAIMDRVESIRRYMAQAQQSVARVTPAEPAWEQTLEAEYREPPPRVQLSTSGVSLNPGAGHHRVRIGDDVAYVADINVDREITELTRSDEENARLDRIAQMRRDMAREIEEFRFRATEAYQRRMPQDRTTEHFQRWSQWVEDFVANMRAAQERRIAAVMPTPRPPPPVMYWPTAADYGPNAGYRSVRGALGAFTRAVNTTFERAPGGFGLTEERDRIHINGTIAIRRMWAAVSETARRANLAAVPPPPPTTTAWVDEPETDELDIMIKHLPRNGKNLLVVVPTNDARTQIRAKMTAAGVPDENSYVFCVKHARDLITSFRHVRASIFIDPAVFKMHARREGDWTDEQLDAIIELQGEIPDEEEVPL